MEKQTELHQKLNLIQTKLVIPKNQYNAFGKYKYRSCEDILEALKPLLKETGLTLNLDDEVMVVGNRYYIKTSALLSDGTNQIMVSAAAREPESRKVMDESQITGATSSYARKYALNGLFCIDDTKDADTVDNRNGNGGCIDEKHLQIIRDNLKELDIDNDKFLVYMDLIKLEDMPKTDFPKAMAAFDAKWKNRREKLKKEKE